MAKQGINVLYDDAGFPTVPAFTANWTAAASGQVIKAGAGRLGRLIILTAFVGTTTVITVYDNATGTASGTPLFAIAVASGSNVGGTVFNLDLPVVNGISVVGSGGTFTGGVIGFGYS